MSSDAKALKDAVESLPYQDLLQRKEEIQERLQVITIEPLKAKKPSNSGPTSKSRNRSKNNSRATKQSKAEEDNDEQSQKMVPLIEKTTDLHWDFTMKEMMWLATDFQAERKRQMSLAKKIAGGVRQYHKTRESRRVRELAEAELKRRRLAGRIGREVRGWWTKIERVIAYKQKCSADEERRQAMNRQLVTLVKQTEKYTEALVQQEDVQDGDSVGSSDSSSNGEAGASSGKRNNRLKKKHRKRRRSVITIEEALAMGERSRRSKNRVVDYNRVQLDRGDDHLYGESTASDTASDGSFSLEDSDEWTDDETTLLEAEAQETKERLLEKKQLAGPSLDTIPFTADPRELRILQEERNMPIEMVLERYTTNVEAANSDEEKNESGSGIEDMEVDPKEIGDAEAEAPEHGKEGDASSRNRAAAKKVTFAPSSRTVASASEEASAKYDADDDGDASDVEDFVDGLNASNITNEGEDNDDDGEFEADQNEVDDETTIAQEESLPQEISANEEIELLKAENNMSVEELRKLYSGVLGGQENEIKDDTSREESTDATKARSSARQAAILKFGTLEDDDSLGVESTNSNEDDGSDEFEADENEVDDETTLAQEEALPRELSREEEINLLRAENEMTIEDLRKRYAGAFDGDAAMKGSSGPEEPGNGSYTDNPPRQAQKGGALSPSDAKEGGVPLVEAMQNGADENGEDDGEFQPKAGDAIDDETTIDAEERLGRDMSYKDELALLNQENEMSVEELRAKYAGVLGVESENGNGIRISDLDQLASSQLIEDASQEEDAEFVAVENEVDDETTLEAEERLGREMSPEEELAILQRESETPIESLYEMYRKMEEEQCVPGSLSSAEDTAGGGSVRKRNRAVDPECENVDKNRSKRVKKRDSDEGREAIQALEKSAERARKTLASRPFLLANWVKLRAYQQTGLNWLVSLQSRRLNGILADEMGLGKTLQTISLLAYLAAYKGIWGPHLVIVPTSVIVNWETELKRFCPGLKALCYYGSAKRRKELRSGWTKTNWYHVVVTSYQLVVQDAFAFKRKRWYYLILDEAQNIKNFQSQRWQTLINFNTQRRLLLTGTPLQNNLMELWSLLHFLMPYIFRSRKEFSFWFSNPMNNVIEGTANQNEEMIARLHGIIRPFILRRLKKDVETQLPGKFEHIIKCPLSRRQMFFYEEFMSRSSTRQALKKGGNYMGMMNVLMQLRKVCNHPDLFEPRSVVTPFVLNPLTIRVPACIVGATNGTEVFSALSQHVVSPLWCGSTSTPSIAASLVHDEVRSTALSDLEDKMMEAKVPGAKSKDTFEPPNDTPPALVALLHEIDKTSDGCRKSTLEFQRDLNSQKCNSPAFLCPSRLLRAVQVSQHPVYNLKEDLLSTPSQLLAARRNQHARAEQVDDTIKNFVFCVPKAGAPRPGLEIRTLQKDGTTMEEMLFEPVETYLRPFRKARARLTSFFPDKKLIQFDAGKLQTLAELLHNLKRGGHRVLIFTQMSKMLDILEAFLNLNGHTYVRLDGSTGVDRRQRLMDRFNNDTKIFSFILSTRSGGMGINLTGADTVVFYDSDWNPAMDAQAQDRAHRIGQTREVHIYRLITEHSIEENILIKAQQKRNLDIIVMDKGKFDGSTARRKEEKAKADLKRDEPTDVFTTGGLRAILGVNEDTEARCTEEKQAASEDGRGERMSREQMEAAMTNLEDQDDVIALRGAQKEAAEELREFDESIELKESDNEGDDGDGEDKPNAKGQAKPTPTMSEEAGSQRKNEEEELAKEFAAWQDNVGLDTSALEASLAPTEKYGLNFRQEIDPFYSVFAIMEERRRLEASEETKDEIDMDGIEHLKAIEERRAIDDGDLLATRPRPEDLVRQRNLYRREKARLKASKKRRKLTGENWEVREDARTMLPFWYNTDTGEALWDKPRVLWELEAEEAARQKLWTGLSLKPLVHIMSFLLPFPDRVKCSKVCRQWRLAANDISFVRHVYPVEMGALARDEKHIAPNHYRTIAEALSIALPGDTLELGDGHYWVNNPGVSIDFPLKLVGDEHNASNVVIEMSGTIGWRGRAGWIEGVTFRRPKISSGEGSTDDLLRVEKGGRVDIFHSVFDNTRSSSASAVTLRGTHSGGTWENVIVSGGNAQGIEMDDSAKLGLKRCIVRASGGDGISCNQSELQAEATSIVNNGGFGATIRGGVARFVKCHFEGNEQGILTQEDGCKLNCSQNTASGESLSRQNIPGFRPSNPSRR